MKRFAVALALLLAGCAIHKVGTSKSLYTAAVQAQETGNDLEAVASWKALAAQADREIAAGHYLSTNYFMRATARMELGLWDEGFADLKMIEPGALREEEYWIYPLYLVLQGDYYAQNNMTSVASNFYQSVLKKSSYKSSSVYLLALERDINNTIKSIELQAAGEPDPGKYRRKGYEDLSKDVQKYLEEYPYSSVPHYLMADLLAKIGTNNAAVEHLIAALELGLPSQDLQKSAEFLLATIAADSSLQGPLKTTLLRKAQTWWSKTENDSLLRAGENEAAWLHQQDPTFPSTTGTVRWLGVARDGGMMKLLLWEPISAGDESQNKKQ